MRKKKLSQKKTSYAKNTFLIIELKFGKKKLDNIKELSFKISNLQDKIRIKFGNKSIKDIKTRKICNILTYFL